MNPQVSGRSEAIGNLVGLLQEGLRALFLLTPRDPECRDALNRIRLAFGPVWSHGPGLRLIITSEAVEWEGTTILSAAANPGGFGTQLFKGGVRSLEFTPGVEADEVVRFLRVIHRAGILDPDDEDDLATLLWREDFNHLHYTTVGAEKEAAGLPPPPPPKPKEPVAKANIRKKVREDAATADRVSGIAKVEEYDSTLYFLDRGEIEYLKEAIEKEYARNHAKAVVSLLLDTFELQSEIEIRNEVISALEYLLPQLLGDGDFSAAAHLISEVGSFLSNHLKMAPQHKQALSQLSRRLSEPEALAQLFHVLQDAETLPPSDELTELLSHLSPEVMGTLFLWLQRLTRPGARDVLFPAVRKIMQEHPRALALALGSSDNVVVLRALDLVRRFKIESATPSLSEIRTHSDSNIRLAVVSALATIRSSEAFQILTLMLGDSHAEVRIGILQAMITRPFRGAMAKVEDMLQDKGLEDLDLSEKRVLFEVYGILAGPSGTAPLSGLLRGKSGFGRRGSSSDTRACAALALGRIGTPPARMALERALRDKDPVVRNAASRALRREG